MYSGISHDVYADKQWNKKTQIQIESESESHESTQFFFTKLNLESSQIQI